MLVEVQCQTKLMASWLQLVHIQTIRKLTPAPKHTT